MNSTFIVTFTRRVFTLCLIAYTCIATAQIGPPPSYSKVSSRSYNYSEMNTGTAKTLYVRGLSALLSPCEGGEYAFKSLKKATINGKLNLGEDYRFGNSTYNYIVTIDILGYVGFSGGSPIFSSTRVLELDCDGSACQPEQQFSMDFTTQHTAINRFDVTATITAQSGLSTTQTYLDLDVYYSEEFLYSYSAIPSITLTSLGQTISDNPVTFDWTHSCGAPNYEFQLLRLYNIDPLNANDESTIRALVDWKQALSIETGSSLTELTLTLAEGSGYYIWRVRPIGNAYEGGIANDRNWGPWNEDDTFIQDTLILVNSGSTYDNLFFYNQFDDNKNWIYSRSFVEGDIRNNTAVNIGENITYANGLQMVKQKQVKLNTENKILVNQTLQDFSGRASLVTMAAPIDSAKLGYVNRYIKNSLDSLYTAADFDADNNYNNATSTAIGNNSQLFDYYSNTNADSTIPNAEGFPFSRTLYFRDGTNRPKEQSSPGFTHRLKTSDSVRHTVCNLYSSVSDIELVRVFGDEAPVDTSVHKMITMDANNSASVTYVSKEGQTIATCMSKPGSALLDTLASQLTAGFTVTDTITGNVAYGTNGLSSLKNVCFTEPTSLTLNYDILPALYGDTCSGICNTCDYNVTFFITNQDDSTGNWSHTEIINPDSCVNNALSTYDTTRLLDPGCYVIERRIVAYTENPLTGSTYISEQDSILNTQLETLFSSGTGLNLFDSSMVDMDSIYHFINANETDSLNSYLGLSASDTTTLIGIVFDCDTLHIPVERCVINTCDTVRFEEYMIARWDTTLTTTIDDYIPQYSAGEFNNMIENMLTAGYSCDELWTCWEGIVQNYQNNLNQIDNINANPNPSGVVPQPDLLMDFLNCTGYQMVGMTTTATGTPGYLSHPFAYFNYTFGNNSNCEETFCGGACITADTAAFTNDDWNNFYLCTKYNNVPASNPGPTTSIATVHQMIDSCKAICDSRFDSFVASLVDLYQGEALAVESYAYPTPDSLPATDTVLLSTLYCQAENLVNQCASQCDLTIFTHDAYATIDSVGTPAQRTAFAEAMTYNFDLSRDSLGYCSGIPAVSDSIEAIDLMVRFLNRQLQNIKDTTGSSGTSWNYLTPLTAFEPTLASTPMWTNMNTHPYVYIQPDVPSYFIQSTSPEITRTDSTASVYFTYKRTIQKNVQPGKDFTVTSRVVLKQNLDTTDNITITESLGSSLLRLVSGTMSLTKHGPLTAGTEIIFSYTVHDSSAFVADSTYSNIISGTAVSPDTTLARYSNLVIVSCPTIYYYFNKARTPDKTESGKPMVNTTAPSPGTLGVSYSSLEYITIDSLIRRDPTKNAFAYIFSSTFNINMSSPSASKFSRLSKARDKGVKDTTHVYVYNDPYWNGDLGYRPPSAMGPGSSATFCGTKGSCAPICLNWKPLEFPDSLIKDTLLPITCAQQAASYIKTYVATETQRLIDNHRARLQQSYQSNCVKGATLLDHFVAGYPLGYYHYTLYYYDRAGNLVKTVPPEGVRDTCTNRSQHPGHTFVTEYTPNSLKQVVRQKTPDGGETRFWYDNKSRLRFSQNAKQLLNDDYSYTKYDNLGRITEVGELHDLDTLQVNSQAYPATGNERERTITVYSQAASGITYFNNIPQRYLQNRVSYSYTDVDGNPATLQDKVSTYFSYDPHGNVEWVIQEQPELGKSYIAYQYDVVSGSVLEVSYNEALTDKFFHRYTYDVDKRIKTVQTSKDGLVWDNDATYTYYPHGPLKRTVIGEDSVQGTDYVYTIQGWLKAMNHSSLDVNNDPSKDAKAATAHQYTAKDVYGMVLGYYAGDFSRTNSAYNAGATYTLAGGNLFNGNISSWTNNIGHVVGTLKREQLTGTKYRYDELNRIKLADFNYYASGWNDTTTYDETFAYDANGNITNLTRNGYYNGSNVNMDNLTYNYASGKNQLTSVDDAVSSIYNDDIDDQSPNNYSYDAIGNLTTDVAEDIDSIYWNVYGKIAGIKKSNGDSLRFLYNAAGQRVTKQVIPNATPHNVAGTYYSVDASGNAMAIYERSNTGSSPDYVATIKLSEQPIYGSERIGERKDTTITIAALEYTDTTPPVAGTSAIVHADTLSPLYLPVVRSSSNSLVKKKILATVYTLQTNYAGAKELNTETPAVNDNILLSATQATQGKYAIKLKDNCGKTILSANSVTLQGFINRANPAVTQVCYVYDENNHLLINSSGIIAGSQSQMAFIKVPGSGQQYYLFTLGADKKAYYHVIDIAQSKVLSKNNLLDSNTGYGLTMKVLEDLAGTGSSQLYLRRINTSKDSTYIVNFEISVTGIAAPHILTKFVSKDVNGVGEIELNPDATKMLVANTKGGSTNIKWYILLASKNGELKQFALNTAHDSVTATSSAGLGNFTSARSVAYNADGTNIYYNKEKFGVYSLHKYSSTYTSPNTVLSTNGSGDVRRGNDDRLYAALPNTATVYTITDGTTPSLGTSLLAATGTKFTGGLQRVNHLIHNGMTNCTNTDYFTRNLLRKNYELKDHLGNVRVVINDMKLWDDIDNDDIPDGGEFRDSVLSYNNYYAFGAPQPSRNYNQYTGADGYRYSFNGKENDVETVGTAGGTQDYGFRIYNPSLGKFLSVDPLTMDYPELTPYQFASNTPIQAIDLDGAEKDVVIWKLNNGKKPTKLKQMSYYALMKQNVGFLGHGTIHYFYNAESKKIVGAVYEPESILDMFLRKGEEEYQESRKAAMGGINVDQEGTEDPTDFNVLDYGNLEPEVEKPKTYDIQPRKEEEFNAPVDEIVMDEKGDSATHYYSIDKDNVKTQRISKETAKARHDNKGIPISKEPPKETK